MKLAIIGTGPRGLSALERLLIRTAKSGKEDQLEIVLFEESHMLGYGHVYDIEQPDTNWINITERALEDLRGREGFTWQKIKFDDFPTYTQSSYALSETKNPSYPDLFPRRSTVGSYLKERFESLASPLKNQGLLSIVKKKVTEIDFKEDQVIVVSEDGKNYSFDEALITIGHQPTENDEQLDGWISFVAEKPHLTLIEEAYPIKHIQNQLNPAEEETIAVRGFGLAAIDVIRALVELYDGSFKSSLNNMRIKAYQKCSQPLTIIPFSLDGLPPVPKPYNEEIDQLFKPDEERLQELIDCLKKEILNKPISHLFLVDIMSELIGDMYLKYKSIDAEERSKIYIALVNWILDETRSVDYMTDHEVDSLDLMKTYVRMAEHEEKASLDYFAGQVWRHCQPTFYTLFSHSELSDEVMSEIIKIDERIKRYSYGPPVASIQQLILLADKGTLDLRFLQDPNIDLNPNGWRLEKEEELIESKVMINSIIDSPKLLEITSPIVKNLLENDVIKPVHRSFGIKTREDGQIISPDNYRAFPIYILGRIAKGSVIGVDAILECFGDRIDRWAESCVERI